MDRGGRDAGGVSSRLTDRGPHAQQKFTSDLVMKALESESAEQRLESLKLLVETNLLKDADVQRGVKAYAKAKEADPSTIPRVVGSAHFEPPVVSNPRVYLLAGEKSKEPLFQPYRQELEAAGFQVLGAKTISDEGRPASQEVRFFYPEDQAQAERIAEVVRFKLSVPQLPAKPYSDQRVKPGYEVLAIVVDRAPGNKVSRGNGTSRRASSPSVLLPAKPSGVSFRRRSVAAGAGARLDCVQDGVLGQSLVTTDVSPFTEACFLLC